MLSDSTLKKLQGIRKCSINGHKVKNLFQIILNAPDLWERAYANIYSNKGGMTPGSDGLTIDGYSEERATNLRELLRENRYMPTPVKRVYIPKPNGKQRPLGIPNPHDKQVQEVWRLILESIYEPVFKDSSHGFRMQRSCHTALEEIVRTWTGTKWFIEFDIEGYFDNIDHNILMALLEKKIDDTKFLNVIRKMLKAGYMENWKFHKTYSGTPQGGIISPILANIYLHELDCFMETLISTFNKGKVRAHNLPYMAKAQQAARLSKKIDQQDNPEIRAKLIEEKRELQRQYMEIPSLNLHDPDYRRLHYCRYADDFVLGAICPKDEAERIYQTIEKYLKEVLKLNISKAKSGLKHNREVIRFLGYNLTVKQCERIVKCQVRGQYSKKRSLKARIYLEVPTEKLQAFATKHQYGNWETMNGMHKAFLMNASDVDIAMKYSAEMRGIAQYYALAKNFSPALGRLRYLWIQSLLKTLACKHQMSVQQVATMLNRGGDLAIEHKGKDGKKRYYVLFRLKDIRRKAIHDSEVDKQPLTFKYTGGVELLKRIDARACEYCERKNGYFEVHHIRGLADIKNGTEPWQKLMQARQRKTMVLCIECHDRLHAGTLPDRRHLLM